MCLARQRQIPAYANNPSFLQCKTPTPVRAAAIETAADINGRVRPGHRLTFQNFKMFPSLTDEGKVSSLSD